MERKERIEQEVKKTLECFETLEKVEPNPFFYTRLQAKIKSVEEQKERAKRTGFAVSYFRPAVLVCLMVLNVLSAILVFQGGTTDQTNIRSQYIAAFAEEYALTQEEDALSLSSN